MLPSLVPPAGLFLRHLDPAKLDTGMGWAVQPLGSPLGGHSSGLLGEGRGWHSADFALHWISCWLGNSQGSVEGSWAPLGQDVGGSTHLPAPPVIHPCSLVVLGHH